MNMLIDALSQTPYNEINQWRFLMSENTHEKTKNPNIHEAREHFKAARKAMYKSVESILPPGVRENQRTARKEILMGMRKMVDAAIDRVEKED